MQLSSIPAKIAAIFAASAAPTSKNTIPLTQAGILQPGQASYDVGFPAVTMQPAASGGINPYGQDFNGILNAATGVNLWNSAGGTFPYDAAFSTSIGGYPMGSCLARADGTGFWFNTVDNNTSNPDGATPTGWVPEWQYGITAVSGLTNANVTLTSLQYGRSVITFTGTLTGNVQIIFPAIPGEQWLLVNGTTGAFSLTAKTAIGTGVVIPSGQRASVFCDGTNLLQGSTTPVVNFAIISTTGSFTVPANVYVLDAEVWGGGGGGGGIGSSSNGSAGGGGGGGYARGILAVTPGQVITATIGAAGIAGAAGATGGTGGTTTFSTLSATGGSGGSPNGGGTGGAGGGGTGPVIGFGGSGSGGLGAGLSGPGGPGGAAPFGGPGGGSAVGIAGAGCVPGGGGGGTGSSVAQAGTVGARGQINIRY